MSSIRRRHHKRKPMSEINVVPYIDVMLVLLVIFMTTAPLLTEGVQVDLPQASAKIVEEEQNIEKFIVTVDVNGELYANEDETPSSPEELRAKAAAVLKYQPKTPFYVKGDKNATYEKVLQAMVMLQSAGVPSVGMVSQPQPAQSPAEEG